MAEQAVATVSFHLIIYSAVADFVSLVYMYLRLEMDSEC